MANKVILSKTKLNFAQSSDSNYIWEGELENLKFNTIIENNKYFIYWDNKEFECVPKINENSVELSETNNLFSIIINADDLVTILTTETDITHTISIYEYINQQLQIANHRGQAQYYGEYDNIVFNTPNKEKVVYSKLPEVISEEDEGKILGITDGIWQKLEAKFASSWNDLTDKPFEKKEFTENGIVPPTPIIEIPDYGLFFGKFFDITLTKEEYFSSTFYISFISGGAHIYQPQTECINIENKILIDAEEYIIICYEPCTVNVEGIDLTFTESGIYFGTSSNFDEIKAITLVLNYTKKLNEDFSPILENKIDIIPLISEEESIVQFYWDDSFGCWISLFDRTEFALEQDIEKAWNEFVELKVNWGGSQYNVTPQKIIWNDIEYIAAGNLINFGGTGNGEPFIIVGGYLLNNDIFNLLIMDIIEPQSDGQIGMPITIDLLYNPSKKVKAEYINQINWFQNDSNAGDFIKNRPFGSYKEGTVLYDGTLSKWDNISGDGYNYYQYIAPYNGPIPPIDSVINITINNSFTYQKIVDGELAESDDQIGITILLEAENTSDNHSYIITIAKYHTDNISIIGVMTTNQDLKHININFYNDTNCPIPIIYIPKQIRTNLLPKVQTADNGKIMTVLDGEWQLSTLPSSLPAVTTSDAGKFLRVNSSGQWVAQTMTNAEEVSF